jgi:hypothetical protein
MGRDCRSPVALRVPHYPNPAGDHEPASRLLRDRNLERGAGQFERAADRQRLVSLPLRVPFLNVEVEAGQPMVPAVSGLLSPPASSALKKPLGERRVLALQGADDSPPAYPRRKRSMRANITAQNPNPPRCIHDPASRLNLFQHNQNGNQMPRGGRWAEFGLISHPSSAGGLGLAS